MSLNILVIETATNVCSVALFKEDILLALEESEISNSHSSNITLFIDKVLKKSKIPYHELSAIAFSSGPGSYTGLRIGVSAAKALSYTLNIPLITYNTLQSIACKLIKLHKNAIDGLFGAAIDARRDEVFLAIYDEKLNPVLAPANVVLKKNCLQQWLGLKKLIIAGTGAEKVICLTKNSEIIYDYFVKCSSKNSIELILEKYRNKLFADISYFEPDYIKPFFTIKKPNL